MILRGVMAGGGWATWAGVPEHDGNQGLSLIKLRMGGTRGWDGDPVACSLPNAEPAREGGDPWPQINGPMEARVRGGGGGCG